MAAAASNREIRRTDLDGLATFWAEGLPGPAQAWLVFRVGAADETLHTRGVTRLVTGLALDGAGSGAAAYGAFVGGPTTAFELNGTPEQVADLLHQVWQGLSSGAERLEEVREREILHSGMRRPDASDHLLATRFGPHGPGLSGQPELGLHHLGADEVLSWRQRYFGTANAALSLKNVSPEDLGLPPRPHGERRPLDPGPQSTFPLPAWFEEDVDDVTVSSLLPGSPAADTFSSAAVWRLRHRLGDGGRVELSSSRVWPGTDHVAISCAGDACAALTATLDELASDGPTEAEIDMRAAQLREWRGGPDSFTARLEWAAHRHALGGPADEETAVPEAREVAAAAREFLANALFRVPPNAGEPPPFHHLSGSSDDGVTGATYAHAGDAHAGTLVVGPDGLTVTLDGRRVTVRFDACEAVAQWPDGTLDVFGSDGFGAQIRPQEWIDGDAAVAAVVAGMPGRVVAMRPPRD